MQSNSKVNILENELYNNNVIELTLMYNHIKKLEEMYQHALKETSYNIRRVYRSQRKSELTHKEKLLVENLDNLRTKLLEADRKLYTLIDYSNSSQISVYKNI